MPFDKVLGQVHCKDMDTTPATKTELTARARRLMAILDIIAQEQGAMYWNPKNTPAYLAERAAAMNAEKATLTAELETIATALEGMKEAV